MKVKNLCFQHEKEAPYFFKNLSFELEEGRIHALHGKNGAGKSLLLHLLSKQKNHFGITTGDIFTEKTVLMGQQFDQALAGRFTFLQNLSFSLFSHQPSLFTNLKPFILPDEGFELLKRLQIDVRCPVEQLSGGQRQVLALFMKLQSKPQVLLLDEPTSNLDKENAIMVFEYLKKAFPNTTILIVCHDPELIERYTTGRHFHLQIGTDGVRRISL